MPTLSLTLLAGRFHATPWGALANEGAVEWPPSPWRMLRGLLAAGFTRGRWNEVPDDVRTVIARLAAVDPFYRLPAAVPAHTRHWMPTSDGKTRVLDTFVAVSRDEPILVTYRCELEPKLVETLSDMVDDLAYLGRAESWIEGHVLRSDTETVDDRWCRPAREADPDHEKVPVLAPMTPASYVEWLASQEESRPAAPRGRGRQSLPPDTLQCLLMDTARLQKEGWTQPPGSRWVLYRRPADALRPIAPRPIRRRPRGEPVEAMVLRLAAVPDRDGRRGVLPLLTRALPQAEFLHQAAIAKLGVDAPACSALTGRAADGRPLAGHSHAHYLPLDLDQDGRLDHFLVCAAQGLDQQAQEAIARIERTWKKDQIGDLLVRAVGQGSLSSLAPVCGKAWALLGRGRVWSSVTPFVPPRFMKKSRHTLQDQVRAELASRGFPPPAAVEVLPPSEIQRRKLLSFVINRRKGKPQPPAAMRLGLRITFDEDVAGPVAIGYGSHFGLGTFRAEPVA